MDLLGETYEDMRELETYMENRNKSMSKTIEEDKGIMLELKRKSAPYRKEYLKLVILSNDLMDKIPKKLKSADAMMDALRPPKEIYDFIRLCRYMVDGFRAWIKRRC